MFSFLQQGAEPYLVSHLKGQFADLVKHFIWRLTRDRFFFLKKNCHNWNSREINSQALLDYAIKILTSWWCFPVVKYGTFTIYFKTLVLCVVWYFFTTWNRTLNFILYIYTIYLLLASNNVDDTSVVLSVSLLILYRQRRERKPSCIVSKRKLNWWIW